MTKSLLRQTQDSIMPKGSAWDPVPNGDNDNLQEGLAQNNQDTRDFLEQSAYVRNPQLTPFLADLEKEYGLYANGTLTEQQRRDRVEAEKHSDDIDGLDHTMQAALQMAGFDVQVHRNNPPVDPAIFLTQAFRMTAGNETSVAGNENAIAGITGGELVVAGDIFRQEKAIICAGNENMVAGNEIALAGYFEGMLEIPIRYEIPIQGYWPLVFFIGGDATRDVSGALTSIDFAYIPFDRRAELINLIVKFKPMFSWCGLIASYY